MLAFNDVNNKTKKVHFENAINNLSHIKYYYLEALYYYTLFLKEYSNEGFIRSKQEGLKKSKEFHYQYIYHLFNNIDNENKYNFKYSFYPTLGLKEYVTKHNEFWNSEFEKEK